jgi:Undecaprenyl-phosphate glucose phosphotransferase
MADDAGACSAFARCEELAAQKRRGPMRPERLQSARTRLSGALLVRLFLSGDLLVLLAASAAAALIVPAVGAEALLYSAPLFAFLTLLGSGAYRMTSGESLLKRLGRVLLAAAAGLGGGTAVLALVAPATSSSHLEAVWTTLVVAALSALQLTWSAVIARLRRRGLLTPNVIVVGATPAAEHLVRHALRSRELNVLGVFDDRRSRIDPAVLGVPVLGGTDDLLSHRILPYVDRIIVAVPRASEARVAQLLQRLAPIPNPVALLMEDDENHAEAVSRVADFALVQISGPPRRTGYQITKRALDLALGSVLLLVFLPLMCLVAAAIKLDSPGPVFFRQRRHGYLNEEIVVWKFRSMRTDAADATASRQVCAGDDRVTRIGRFIRKTSIDELPQLFNVLAGEMSLVGPRPHAIGMLAGGAEASQLVATYAHRHRMKPGLTGWAAVNGSRGPVDTPEAVQRRVALDLEYVERQSIWVDLAIILKTAPCLLGDAGAVR